MCNLFVYDIDLHSDSNENKSLRFSVGFESIEDIKTVVNLGTSAAFERNSPRARTK